MRISHLLTLVLTTSAVTACSQIGDMAAPLATPSSALLSSSASPKIEVCHVNGTGALQPITVSGNAYAAHLAHGDIAQGSVALAIPAGSVISASSDWAGRTAALAFDGNSTTEWNAGTNSGWIEIDFGSPQTFTGMTGLVDQVPDGNSDHAISFDGVSAFTWTGYHFNGQTLTQSFATPKTARVVRITTPSSPSWVAWVEIAFTRPTC